LPQQDGFRHEQLADTDWQVAGSSSVVVSSRVAYQNNVRHCVRSVSSVFMISCTVTAGASVFASEVTAVVGMEAKSFADNPVIIYQNIRRHNSE